MHWKISRSDKGRRFLNRGKYLSTAAREGGKLEQHMGRHWRTGAAHGNGKQSRGDNNDKAEIYVVALEITVCINEGKYGMV